MPDTAALHAGDRYRDVTLAPGGDEVAYVSDLSGSFQVWRQSVEGGSPRLATEFHDRIARRVAYSPDGTRLAVAAGPTGRPPDRIVLLPLGSGPARLISAPEGTAYLLPPAPWSQDAQTLLCAAGAPGRWELTLLDAETGGVRCFSGAGRVDRAACWSADGRHFCGIRESGEGDDRLLVADRETQRIESPTAGRPPALRRPLAFSADGSALYLVTDEGRETAGLARLDLAGGTLEWLRRTEWDVVAATVSFDRRFLLFVESVDSRHKVRLFDRNTGLERRLADLPEGRASGLSIAAAAPKAALLLESNARACSVWILDLISAGARPLGDQTTVSAPQAAVEPRSIRFLSFDRKLPALVYPPAGTPPRQGWPAVVWVEADVASPRVAGFASLAQALADRGVCVAVLNARGARGWGKSFRLSGGTLADGVRDVDALRRALPAWGADPARCALFGRGRGALLALRAAAETPRTPWRAAAALAPPAGAPLLDAAAGTRLPLLLIRGSSDPDLSEPDAREFLRRARTHGAAVEEVVVSDGAVGDFSREHDLDAARRVFDFLLASLSRA